MFAFLLIWFSFVVFSCCWLAGKISDYRRARRNFEYWENFYSSSPELLARDVPVVVWGCHASE